MWFFTPFCNFCALSRDMATNHENLWLMLLPSVGWYLSVTMIHHLSQLSYSNLKIRLNKLNQNYGNLSREVLWKCDFDPILQFLSIFSRHGNKSWKPLIDAPSSRRLVPFCDDDPSPKSTGSLLFENQTKYTWPELQKFVSRGALEMWFWPDFAISEHFLETWPQIMKTFDWCSFQPSIGTFLRWWSIT